MSQQTVGIEFEANFPDIIMPATNRIKRRKKDKNGAARKSGPADSYQISTSNKPKAATKEEETDSDDSDSDHYAEDCYMPEHLPC